MPGNTQRGAGVLVWPGPSLVKTDTIPLSHAHSYQLRAWPCINPREWPGQGASALHGGWAFYSWSSAAPTELKPSDFGESRLLLQHIRAVYGSANVRQARGASTPSICWALARGLRLLLHSPVCAQQGCERVLCPSAPTPAYLHHLSITIKCSQFFFPAVSH